MSLNLVSFFDMVQVLAAFALVPLLVAGWREVISVVGYSCIMLTVLTHVRSFHLHPIASHPAFHFLAFVTAYFSCLQFVAVGVHFLIFGHLRNIETCCAMLFMAFSSVKLLQSSFDFGKERMARAIGTKADTPRSRQIIKFDETETLVLELQDGPFSETKTGTPHWHALHGFLQDHPRLRSCYECLFPAISVQGYAVETIVVVSSLFCALSGISQGTTGSGGPPRIVAYTVLDFSKGAIRGLTAINLVSSLSVL